MFLVPAVFSSKVQGLRLARGVGAQTPQGRAETALGDGRVRPEMGAGAKSPLGANKHAIMVQHTWVHTAPGGTHRSRCGAGKGCILWSGCDLRALRS